MKEEDRSLSLKSVEFILRHPLLFICPLVMISSLTFAYVSSIKLNYQCVSVLSFEVPGGTVIDTKLIQKKTDFIARILLGDNIKYIAEKVWPEVKEKTNPMMYNGLIERLRHNKFGILIQYDKRDPRLLIISFMNTNPNTCYAVVKTTIEAIKAENKRSGQKEMTAGLTFLRNQIEFYKNKIRTIDEEVSKIKTELKQKAPDLTDRERELVGQITGQTQLTQTQAEHAVQKAVKYEEIIAELNLQMLELERKKAIMQKRLKSGNIATPAPVTKNFEEDTFIKEYSKAIATKELDIANFTSQGYMPEHPNIKRLQREIDELNELKAKRLKDISTPVTMESSASVKKQAELTMKAELEDIESQIGVLQDKINLMGKYQKDSESQFKQAELQPGVVSELASRLKELETEKQISTTYYSDLRRQLETAEIKNRLEKEEAGFDIKIVEEPRVPLKPIPFQKIPKIMLGLLMALAVGVSLSYIADAMDNSIKLASQLRDLLQTPILASIDQINTPQDVAFPRIRRNLIIIGLILFAILSKFIIKFFVVFL